MFNLLSIGIALVICQIACAVPLNPIPDANIRCPAQGPFALEVNSPTLVNTNGTFLTAEHLPEYDIAYNTGLLINNSLVENTQKFYHNASGYTLATDPVTGVQNITCRYDLLTYTYTPTGATEVAAMLVDWQNPIARLFFTPMKPDFLDGAFGYGFDAEDYLTFYGYQQWLMCVKYDQVEGNPVSVYWHADDGPTNTNTTMCDAITLRKKLVF